MTRYRFDAFTVDTETVEIIGPDGAREVEPQVFQVLQYLVAQGGRLVSKEELFDNVWGDRFVSESALTTRIKQARRAVDDDGSRQWAIRTVHGRGYRFVPEVHEVDEERTPRVRPMGEGADAAGTSPGPRTLPDELRPNEATPFCGRVEELHRSLSVLARGDAAERFGWVWLLGEPGIGKTRLAAEVARHAHDAGHRVLFSRNNEDLRVPYQPFIEMLRAVEVDPLVDLPPGLDRLWPSTSEARRGGDVTGVESEALRYELFEAVAGWLTSCGDDTPTVVVIDDVHWASESTLQLLAHLARRPAGGAVTFVLTARDTAPDVNPRVLDLLAAAQGDPATAVLRLDGLDGPDALRLIGDDPDVDVEAILRQTAGNPLFLQAVGRAGGSVDIASAVHGRLTRLDPRVQDLLRAVSVFGLEFELTVAAAANRLDELDLLDVLEQAVAARLVEDIGAGRFRFTHALVRSSLRDGLSSARRARIHAHIAEAIADLYGDRPDHQQQLAFHTAEAAAASEGLRPVAVERLRHAAELSAGQFSFLDAADLLRRARSFGDHLAASEQCRLALDQGIVEADGGYHAAAAATFEEAMELARTAGDVALIGEAAVRFENTTWPLAHLPARALELVDEAIDALDAAPGAGAARTDEARLRAQLAVGRFRSLALLGTTPRAEVDAAFAAARRQVAEFGSASLEARLISTYLAQALMYEVDGEALPMVRRLAEIEPAIDDRDAALHAVHDQFIYAVVTGDVQRQDPLLGRLEELQERAHSGFWAFCYANQTAMLSFYRGNLAEAESEANRCRVLAEALPGQGGAGTFGLRMFLIRREQDRLAAMLPLVRHVLARTSGDALWTPGLALLLAETGRLDEAATILAPIRDGGFAIPRDGLWGTVLVFLVETAVALGDVRACELLLDEAAPLAGANVTTASGLVCFGRAERYLGMLAFILGDLAAAEQWLGVALEGDVDGGSVLWGNESRLWLSRVRRAQGHDAEADAMAGVVRYEAEAAGLARLARLAEAELAR